MIKQYYNVSEAARVLDVSKSTVWRWIEADRLRAHRIGPKTIRIKHADLVGLIEPMGKEAAAMTEHVVRTDSRNLIQRPTPAMVERRKHAREQVRVLRATILARRGGVSLPSSSVELIHEGREERDRQLDTL